MNISYRFIVERFKGKKYQSSELLFFILFLVSLVFMLGKTIDPLSPTGIYELPGTAVKLVAESSVSVDKLRKITSYSDATIATQPIDNQTYVYDSGNWFLNHSNYVENINRGSNYFNRDDYTNGVSKVIKITTNYSGLGESQFVMDTPILEQAGVKELKNLFSLSSIKPGTVMYLYSAQPAQQEECQNILKKAGFSSSPIPLNFPPLIVAVCQSLQSNAYARFLFVPVSSLCLLFFLLAGIKKTNNDVSLIADLKSVCRNCLPELAASLLILYLLGFKWQALRYSVEITLLFGSMVLIINWLVQILARFTTREHDSQTLSTLIGVLTGLYLVGSIVLLSSLIPALFRGIPSEIVFITFGILCPLIFCTVIAYQQFHELLAEDDSKQIIISIKIFGLSFLATLIITITWLTLLLPTQTIAMTCGIGLIVAFILLYDLKQVKKS